MPQRTMQAGKVAIKIVGDGPIRDIESVSQKDAVKRAEELAKEQEKPVIFVEKIIGGLFLGLGRAPVETLLSGNAAGSRVEIDLVIGGLAAARRRANSLVRNSESKVEIMEEIGHTPATKEEIEKLRKEWPASVLSEQQFSFSVREFHNHYFVKRITVCEWTEETERIDAGITARLIKDRRTLHLQRRAVEIANRHLKEDMILKAGGLSPRR